jgi:hypothetical protein
MADAVAMRLVMIKRCTAWILALVAALGVFISYWGIYVLVAYFAAGLVVWAELALLISGPIGAAAAGLGWIRPRQRFAMTIGLLAFGAWLLLWILMFTVLGFGFNS